MRITRVLATFVGTIAMALAGSVVANAAPVGTVESDGSVVIDEDYVRDFLTRYDVPETTQDNLVQQLEAGELLDYESGVTPAFVEQYVENNTTVTISRYPDGSLTVDRVSIPVNPSGGIQPQVVSNCIYSAAGSNAYQKKYVDCLASHDTVGAYLSFTFDYTKFNGASTINAVRNAVIRLSSKKLSSKTLQITRATTSGTTIAAKARLTVYSTAGDTTYTNWLELRIYGSASPTTAYSS